MLERCYRNLILLPTFDERYEYLKLQGVVGQDIFGFDRYLNQRFYTSTEWRRFRNKVIERDDGNDLGLEGYPIGGNIIIHHLNPLTIDDFEDETEALFDFDNVICVSNATHQAIHYGDKSLLPAPPLVRTRNDTCPWR